MNHTHDMLVRVDFEPFRLFYPNFANVFVGCQPLKDFEPSGEVIGHQERVQMLLQLVV